MQPSIRESIQKSAIQEYCISDGGVSLNYDVFPRRYDVYLPVYGTRMYLHRTESRIRSPAVTPNYKKLVDSGKLLSPLQYEQFRATIPYASRGVGWVRSMRSASYAGKVTTYELRSFRGVIGMDGPSPSNTLETEYTTQAEKIAITKLLEKAKDGKFNGAQAYAEAGQLERLIGESTKKLARTLEYLRKGKLRLAASTLGLDSKPSKNRRFSKQHRRIKTDADIDRLMSNGVLQVQYGIRPLLNDVVGAAELLAQKMSGFHVSIVSGECRKAGSRVTSAQEDVAFKRYKNVTSCEADVFIKYAVKFTAESEEFHTLKQLGITNPALLAWELLPWSFVIDWFIPIGNYLSTLDATLGLKFQGGYKVYSAKIRTHYTMDMVPANSLNYDIGHVERYDSKEHFVRTVLTGWPSPRVPIFKNPLSWEHALNGIALLAGFRKTAYIR